MLQRMSSRAKEIRGYALVLVAAALWSTIGLFYRALTEEFGIARGVVVGYRVAIPALTLFAVLSVIRPRALRVHKRDWIYFVLFGVVGVAAFYLVYIQATLLGPLAIASVLLYTAPVWITIWSVARQGERLTTHKIIALLLAVGGCTLVANVFDPANREANALAIVFGLLSGLTYAAYSLWSAEGTRRGYAPWTVVAYSLGIGALVLLAVQPLGETLRPFAIPRSWPYLLGVGLGPTLLAPLSFTIGLRHVRASNASILATIEPVLAAVWGWTLVVPPEPLNAWQIAGGACVLAAVIALTRDRGSGVGDRGTGVRRRIVNG
jgi:drug/metabolite transporter, DME family